MTKVLFIPFSVISAFLAGKLATLVFDRLWRLVEDQESPQPNQRAIKWPKLIVALAVEGAIFPRRSRRLRSWRARAVQPGHRKLARGRSTEVGLRMCRTSVRGLTLDDHVALER